MSFQSEEAYSRQYEKQIDGITQFLKSYVKGYSDEDSVGEMLRRLDKSWMNIIVLKVSMKMQSQRRMILRQAQI